MITTIERLKYSIWKQKQTTFLGTYGVVYRAEDKRPGAPCKQIAVKKVRLDNDSEGMPSTYVREISVLRELHHPNVVA